MYPLSHIYVSLQVLDRMDPSLALGSVLPDVLVGTGIIWRKAHHSTGEPFHQHLVSPGLRTGAALHGVDLPGLDYYSDVAYGDGKGYAYQIAVHIEQDIINLGVEPEHALWRGHNFVEMAIEDTLNRQHSQLWQYLTDARADRSLMDQIIELAKSLEATKPEAAHLAIDRFLNIRGQLERLAEDYAVKLNQIYDLNLVPSQIEQIIAKTAGIVEADYREFLDRSIQALRQTLAASPV